jgi:CubicO group peptidase (beta-lactamase class C family)
LNVRVGRIAVLTALAATVGAAALGLGTFGTAAFGQSTAEPKSSAAALDALPKHPIPYRVLKKLDAKPKRKPAVVAPPAATTPQPGAVAAPPTPAPSPAKPPAAPPKLPVQAPVVTAPVVKPAAPPQTAPAPTLPPPAKPQVPVQPAAPPPPPLAVPQSGARLQPGQALPAPELEAFVDGQVSRAMAADHVVGAAVAVVQNGQLVMEKGYGSTSRSSPRHVDPRATLFRLGSGSQIFTWLAVLKAVEDGKLKLDAPINSYLPEPLQIPDEGFDRPILLRHLMTHTAGFEDRALGRRYVLNADKITSLDDGLRKFRPRRVRAAGLLSVPSDYGAALAGAAAAKARGVGFDQLIETEILTPLALNHTSFREPYPAATDLPEPLRQDLAAAVSDGFRWTPQGYEAEPFAYGQTLAPAIAASTTADDMARLMIALLNNGKLGEAALYGPKTAALLRAPLQHPAPGMDGWAHGLSMERLGGGFEAFNDTGSSPVFHSDLTLVPGLNLGIFIVANTNTAGDLARNLPNGIIGRFYGSPNPAPPAGAQTSDVDYSGAYLSADRAYHGLEAFADRLTERTVVAVDDKSGILSIAGNTSSRLFTPLGDGRFRGETGTDLYMPSLHGRGQAYILGSGGGAAERVGGLHSLGALKFWATTAALTVFASFAGLFIRDRTDPRETRPQIAANVVQITGCIAWCFAYGFFGLFLKSDLAHNDLMFAWPDRWLVLASWSALTAGVLTLTMAVQLPGAWREERRIHGWSVWRKLRHTATVGVFLALTVVLAAWGALEPWSS